MKLIVLMLMIFAFSPLRAAEVFSTRIFSTSPSAEEVPNDLSFTADRIQVIHGGWYNSLFEDKSCESSLSGKSLDIPVSLKAAGPHEIELILDHRASKRIHSARASYIPQYFERGIPVRPHYLVKLKDWVILHIAIRTEGGLQTLKVSLVQGRGKDVHLVPVFEAEGR